MCDPQAYLHETASQTAGPYVHIGLVPIDTGIEDRTGARHFT